MFYVEVVLENGKRVSGVLNARNERRNQTSTKHCSGRTRADSHCNEVLLR